MNNFNMTMIEGNLIQNPGLVHGQETYCKMKLESTRSYRDKSGVNHERVLVFDIMTKAKLAETCLKYLKKGSRVLISGYLLGTKDGYIEAKEVNFLPKKESE